MFRLGAKIYEMIKMIKAFTKNMQGISDAVNRANTHIVSYVTGVTAEGTTAASAVQMSRA